MAHEQLILFSEGTGPNRVLNDVVVNLERAVLHELRQSWHNNRCRRLVMPAEQP